MIKHCTLFKNGKVYGGVIEDRGASDGFIVTLLGCFSEIWDLEENLPLAAILYYSLENAHIHIGDSIDVFNVQAILESEGKLEMDYQPANYRIVIDDMVFDYIDGVWHEVAG
jgi:hypothetical protein